MTALQLLVLLATVLVGAAAFVQTALAVRQWNPRFVGPAGWLALALATWCALKGDEAGLTAGAALATVFGILTVRDGRADARARAGREWM